MSVTLRVAAIGLLLMAAGSACSDRTPPPAATVAATLPLPGEPFVAPKQWTPTRGDAKPVAPPVVSDLTWYVLVDQYEPHQKLTPDWKPLAAEQTVEVKMPPGSSLRCVAPPLHIEAQSDELETTFEYWFLTREVLCSSDAFRTFTAYPHRVRLRPDGTRQLDYRSEGWLREHAPDGSLVQTVVSLRARSRGEQRRTAHRKW